ncbi:phage tail tube protein [Falsiroseomonas sp.]|uniref:phage tail tube protein n=1 Tax=Falsiroseomonas sp. TaxID=2870721 RepID=UPI003F6E44E8
MARYSHMVALVKRETTYATDSVPTNTADAVLFQDVEWTPMEADQVERPMVLPYYGNDPVSLVATRNRLVGSVDLAGGGTPLGTAPRYAALLRACGLAEAITATTRVDYTPVSGAEDSASIYHFLDGTRQQGLGARGDFSIEMQARQIPRIRFDLQGLYVAPTAVALPVPTLTGFQAPLPVSQANTPTCTLNGQNVVLRQFQYRHGNQIAMRDMPGSRALRITGRQPTASVTIEAPDGLTPNFFTSLGSLVAFSVTHGTVGGNICTIDLAQSRLLNPRYSNEDNIAMLSFDLRPEPSSAGNDEFRLRLT